MKYHSFLFVAIICFSIPSTAQSYSKGIALFSRTDYRGEHIFIDRDWINTNPNGFGIESVRVPNGWEAWLYEESNFSGDYKILTSNWDGRDSRAWMWRDDIRSIRIVSRPMQARSYCEHLHSHESRITVYEHDGKGKSMTLQADWSVGGNEGFSWNDRISGIHIPADLEVTIYEHANYEGRSMIISGYWKPDEAGFWNDRISSIRIRKSY